MYYCEKCGKLVEVQYGSGRFCCRACANSRIHSGETKKKIRMSVINYYASCPRKNNENKKDRPKRRKIIKDGMDLATKLDLAHSPYSEYNTAFLHKQVGNRMAYKFCLYEGNKLLKSETVLVYRYIMAKKLGRKLNCDIE